MSKTSAGVANQPVPTVAGALDREECHENSLTATLVHRSPPIPKTMSQAVSGATISQDAAGPGADGLVIQALAAQHCGKDDINDSMGEKKVIFAADQSTIKCTDRTKAATRKVSENNTEAHSSSTKNPADERHSVNDNELNRPYKRHKASFLDEATARACADAAISQALARAAEKLDQPDPERHESPAASSSQLDTSERRASLPPTEPGSANKAITFRSHAGSVRFTLGSSSARSDYSAYADSSSSDYDSDWSGHDDSSDDASNEVLNAQSIIPSASTRTASQRESDVEAVPRLVGMADSMLAQVRAIRRQHYSAGKKSL